MSITSRYNLLSPQMLNPNNENSGFNKNTTKQVVSSKKKPLLDVKNTIYTQRDINSVGTKTAEKLKLKEKIIVEPKWNSPVCSPVLEESDDEIIDDHNWSMCDKINEDMNDNFLPNLKLTPEQLEHYALEWDMKPQAKDLQIRDMNWMQIEEPKSCLGSMFDSDCIQLSDFDFDFNFNTIPTY